MFNKFGWFGCIYFRSITYTEDKIEDKRLNYKWSFDVELIPCLKVSNHDSRVTLVLRWLNWEFIWFKYKLKK